MRATYVVPDLRSEDVPPTSELPEASIDAIAVDAFGTALQAFVRDDLAVVRKAGSGLGETLATPQVTPAEEGRNAYQGGFSPAHLEAARILLQEIEALALYAEGKVDEALALLDETTAAEAAGQPIAAREASATLDEFWQGGPERLEQRPGTFSD